MVSRRISWSVPVVDFNANRASQEAYSGVQGKLQGSPLRLSLIHI